MNENTKLGVIICLSIMVGFGIALFLQQTGVFNHLGAPQELVAVQSPRPVATVSPQVIQPQEPVASVPGGPVDVGNKFCPITHRPIGIMGPGAQEVYNGKIYHLCCGGCIGIFESDPEKYSKIADDEVASKK